MTFSSMLLNRVTCLPHFVYIPLTAVIVAYTGQKTRPLCSH